jgi:hypothetical protein
VQSTAWSRDLRVTADGTGVVSHVGAALLRMLADRAGLTAALSAALARRQWWPVHDRGRVLVDLAVMIADGGEAICDIEVLRHQGEVFGPVASPATCWRALDEIDAVRLRRIGVARAKIRARVWALIGHVPAARAAGRDIGAGMVVLDVDSTIVIAHSDKEGAAATYKHTWGFHPINAAWCTAAAIAADLIAWLQILGLHGDLATAEPKRLRYRILHAAARLTHGQRRRGLRIPSTWPWANQITAAFIQIAAIPAPG